jgi:hypothetical protein
MSIPGTIPAGYSLDADVTFDVGAAGTGTVGLSLDASCGTIVFQDWNIIAQ